MQWATTWVFLSFSCIFGCSLTFFSVHLDASHWNLEFFGFTQTTFFVHPKNSRFQCSASRFTEKTVSSQPKMQEKLKKTSGCSLHSFLQHRKYFADGKWLEKNNFGVYSSISAQSISFFEFPKTKELRVPNQKTIRPPLVNHLLGMSLRYPRKTWKRTLSEWD